MKYNDFLNMITQRHSGNIKYGLDRMINLLAELGSPEKKLKGFHVAGTNGKGSTCASLEKMCQALGLTVGLNTSPHLVDYKERIRINGKNITSDELVELYQHLAFTFEKYEASFFEMTTTLAFAHFLSKKVHTSIFEVGLGGRLDGTNPFNSSVTAITSISTDHSKSLGDTIEKIAFEKAGIIKDKTPVVLGKIPDSALNVIKDKANSLSAPIIEFNKDFFTYNIRVSQEGTVFDYHYPAKKISLTGIRLNLLGSYQAINASVAITCFLTYLDIIEHSFNISQIKESIINGLSNVLWQGRFQIIKRNPTVIVDGAHNEEGVENLISNIKAIYPHRSIKFVLAILRDKNLKKMITDICQVSQHIYISKNKSNRAAEIDDQEAIVKSNGIPFKSYETVTEALQAALLEAREEDLIIVSGSLYTISEVLANQNKIF